MIDQNDFKGNAIDFAAFHFKLSGDELLKKINQDWDLHIGEKTGYLAKDQCKALPTPFPPVTTPVPLALPY